MMNAIGKEYDDLMTNPSKSTNSKFNILDILVSARFRKFQVLYASVIIILLFWILIKPYETYLEPYLSKEFPFANFTHEELDAAKWIEKNTPADYLIYSDPITVVEFRGLSYRENLPAISWNKTVIDSVKFVMTSEDPSIAYNEIISSAGEKSLIVISPKTFHWLNGSKISTQFPIEKFNEFNGFKKFFEKKYFTLEYQSQNIFVFTPKLQKLYLNQSLLE